MSFTGYRVLGSIPDEEERFAAIKKPPAGKSRWTVDEAHRLVGRQVEHPETPQEKITGIRSLARDEEVAAAVTSDFLKRPTVPTGVPESEKVRVVEEFTRDEAVASTAVTGLLRQPDVASRTRGRWTCRCSMTTSRPRPRSSRPRSSVSPDALFRTRKPPLYLGL
ncbi:DUF6192 family protein [Streptomyces sp. NPDC059851]|uniref:DUF6192 family protein n=1 Tax=Streptomyces sp. NPDC059851 TaxID=3346971 RepID=UPI00364B360D